jgi:hypothetical protein
MAKTGLAATQIRGLLRARALGPGWALCVGAGVSRPVFPDWRQLVERLIARDVVPGTPGELAKLEVLYSPDAFIQAAQDRLQLHELDFAQLLSNELYADAKATLNFTEWKLFTRALNTRYLGGMPLPMWRRFVEMIKRYYPLLTATGLAESLAPIIDGPFAPCAVLSFNAESLFGAILNGNVAMVKGTTAGRNVIDYVTRSTSNRKANRIPYIFCHGLLPLPTALGQALSAVDKLVFSESAYLQLANNAFSWQSASFIRAAASHCLVFVGLSLSDPNMRRWLSWIHSNRVSELTEAGEPSPTSTVHYWIAKELGSEKAKLWSESLVAHLGIRIVWVNDYADIPGALKVMLAAPGGKKKRVATGAA